MKTSNPLKSVRDTPQWLVDKMWNIINNDIQTIISDTKKLLEPSAGVGNLLNNTYAKEFDITCIELNKDKCDVLHDKGYNALHGDFISKARDLDENTFDVILAAPPFNGNFDLIHIVNMYRLLKPGGIIVTLTSPYWLTNNEEHQVAFRSFLDGKDHSLEMLQDNTFIEKKKTVPTAILTLRKKVLPGQ